MRFWVVFGETDPRESVKTRLGYVFCAFSARPGIFANMWNLGLSRKNVKPRLGHVFGRVLARPTPRETVKPRLGMFLSVFSGRDRLPFTKM